MPRVVIVSAGEGATPPNVRGYLRIFESVSLARQVIPASAIELSQLSAEGLILAVPAESARILRSSQISAVLQLVENGGVLITEEITPLSTAFGFRAAHTVRAGNLQEVAYPKVEIKWERPEQVTALQLSPGSEVLTRERSSGAAMCIARKRGRGTCLVLAAPLDPKSGEGYFRFPYLLQELQSAGIRFPFRQENLSALFDYSYREDSDIAELVGRWSRVGIGAVHVGAWYFFDRDAARDRYLKNLIAECHRNAILVYAWLELPEVSPDFWNRHPEWREKTATGVDALLDWRHLMNLKDPNCFNAVSHGLRRMLGQFDWDGANLAELYFESPLGPEAAKEFTPLNPLVRAEFKQRFSIDPLEFFRKGSLHYWKTDRANWMKFVDYRVEQERILNERFLQLLAGFRNSSGQPLDLAVTYVDNIYDPSMREGVGADVGEMLSLLERYQFTLIMEDPFSVWHLGPRRYAELAAAYGKMTPHKDRLGVDINIVDRLQTVYPTKKQTGTEFLQLFHYAANHFDTVLVYSEQTILDQDLELVSNALSGDIAAQTADGTLHISSSSPVIVRAGFDGDFEVNGEAWPCAAGPDVRLPAGSHQIRAAANHVNRPHLLRLNGELQRAAYEGDRVIAFGYSARHRVLAMFDAPAKQVVVDGHPYAGQPARWLSMPSGTHKVRAVF